MSGTAIAKLEQSRPTELALQEFFRQVRLELESPLTFREWEGLGEVLVNVHKIIEKQRTLALLHIGDWLVYGRKASTDPRLTPEQRKQYEERYSQAASLSGYDPGYLYNIASAAWRWPPARRFYDDGSECWPSLTLGHFQAVSRLDGKNPEKAEQLLDAAEQARWTRTQLREAAAMMVQIEDNPDPVFVSSVFDVLPVENGPEIMQVAELAYYSDFLRDLLLMHAPGKYSRAMHDMPAWVWRMVTELLLAEFTNRSRDERRKDEVEVGHRSTG